MTDDEVLSLPDGEATVVCAALGRDGTLPAGVHP